MTAYKVGHGDTFMAGKTVLGSEGELKVYRGHYPHPLRASIAHPQISLRPIQIINLKQQQPKMWFLLFDARLGSYLIFLQK